MQPSIIKRARISVETDGESVGSIAAGRTATRCAKKAVIIEHGGVVRGIEVTCSCGEATVVEFLAEAPTEGNKA